MNNSGILKQKARELLFEFKRKSYTFGLDCINETGGLAKKLGKRAVLVISDKDWAKDFKGKIIDSLKKSSIFICEVADSAKPNTPVEDVYKLQDLLVKTRPDFVVVAGGGSAIDCAKAAAALAAISPGKHEIEPFFGTGEITKILSKNKLKIIPILAIQMSASSAAHLTRYSNITGSIAGQKKLIVDDSIVPPLALFDYSITKSAGEELTADGVMDGISHCTEVYYGANINKIGSNMFKKIEEIAVTGISLLLKNARNSLDNLFNLEYREGIGLGTDLGGYAIMLGGTNGAHLTSFSLVKMLSHGRACGILNPYWTVFFAPAIRRQLIVLLKVFEDYADFSTDLKKELKFYSITDYISLDFEKIGRIEQGSSLYNLLSLPERQLGEKLAKAMQNFLKLINVPVKLNEINEFNEGFIEKALKAAGDPQLEMKLKNMPVPIDTSAVDEYMRPVLDAAKTGNFKLIKNL